MPSANFEKSFKKMTKNYLVQTVKGIEAVYSLKGEQVQETARYLIQEHNRWEKAWKIKENDPNLPQFKKGIDPGSFVYGMLVMAEQVFGENLLIGKSKGLTIDKSVIEELLKEI